MVPYPITYQMRLQMKHYSNNVTNEIMLQSKREVFPINFVIPDLHTSLMHLKNSHTTDFQKEVYDFSISSNFLSNDKRQVSKRFEDSSNLKFTHFACASENLGPLSKCENQLNSYNSKVGNLRHLGVCFGKCIYNSTPHSNSNALNNYRNIARESSNSLVVTCLHCSTMRRKTGVHQTTQTTDPISPVSLKTKDVDVLNHKIDNSNLKKKHNFMLNLKSTSKKSSISSFISTSSTTLRYGQKQQHQTQIQEINELKEQNNTAYTEDATFYQFINNFKTLDQMTFFKQKPSIPKNEHFISIEHQKSLKNCVTSYINKKISRFFGVNTVTEAEDFIMWKQRQLRFAVRRFGMPNTRNGVKHYPLNDSSILMNPQHFKMIHCNSCEGINANCCINKTPEVLLSTYNIQDTSNLQMYYFYIGVDLEVKTSVMFMFMLAYQRCIQLFQNKNPKSFRQNWSRSFVPIHIQEYLNHANNENYNCIFENNNVIQDGELFFNTKILLLQKEFTNYINNAITENRAMLSNITISKAKATKSNSKDYFGQRGHRWLINSQWSKVEYCNNFHHEHNQKKDYTASKSFNAKAIPMHERRGNRISSQFLGDIPENSHRPSLHLTISCINNLNAYTDYRPYFTYWINTVQIVVMLLSLLCYGIAPIGVGVENISGQVLIPTLNTQKVQYEEPRNVWVGPRNSDLIHIGAKFAACMRRDMKIASVIMKTQRSERETACCIRNDDSGCVQSSQADCSSTGVFSMKSISTWKKWSLGESGPGGRISGSVCGLDPKYCDSPASIAPYEWPDDITKWPICRKTNSFSQRHRLKERTAEHMICEVIAHPCCTGVYGECRITTREHCNFVHGYFHEEASLCSQISCLNNVCGMLSFMNAEVPDQFYRLFTSLCLHAGIFHLGVTLFFQHLFLSDLERLIGSLRASIVYIGSGVAGNLTSAIFLPYKAELGPSASTSGIVASFIVLLILTHWKQIRNPYIALFKLIAIEAMLFAFGSLPWQLNFVGILAGLYCGVILTVTIVPFVNITHYRRKSKINLIWSCIVFHALFYTSMLVVFYMYPTEFNQLNLGEFFTYNFRMGNRGNNGITSNSDLSSVYGRNGKNYGQY